MGKCLINGLLSIDPVNKGSWGKMEHGGKIEHRVFGESMPGVGLVSCPHDFCHRLDQTCNRPRFEYLTKAKFHPFDISIYSCFGINRPVSQ